MPKTKDGVLDSVIIGASAAGMSAAIYLSRQLLNFELLTTTVGGEMITAGTIENYPGIPHTDGVALTQQFEKHLAANKIAPTRDVRVQKITQQGKIFVVQTRSGKTITTYRTKTVIICTGATPRRLNLPGVKEFENRGISYCTWCDGPLFRGKEVAVIGGGNSALEAALFLKDITKKVTLLTINPELVGHGYLVQGARKAKNISVITNATTTGFFGQQLLTGLSYKTPRGEKKLTIQGAFVHVGFVPSSNFVDLVKKNTAGNIVVDLTGQTSVPGIFAAGDVTQTPYKQIAISVGQGVSAALQAISYLQKNA